MGERTARPRLKKPATHDHEALAFILKASGRKQVWLAEKLGIGKGQMSEIVNGTRGLTPEKLRLAARLLDCPPHVLRAKSEDAA